MFRENNEQLWAKEDISNRWNKYYEALFHGNMTFNIDAKNTDNEISLYLDVNG